MHNNLENVGTEIEQEIYPMSVEKLDESIGKLTDEYNIIAKDPALKYDAGQLLLIIKNLEDRKKGLQN